MEVLGSVYSSRLLSISNVILSSKVKQVGFTCCIPKGMAALFFAFNRPHYQKLIVQHLSDLLVMPKEILEHLQSGKFVASLSGRPGHSVAIDEAHEMKINKDFKTSIVRPSTENMNRLSLYLGHRTKLIENLKRQLNQPTSKPNNTSL